MIRDITIGQYYQEKSPIHNLDPRTKIIITFIYLLSLFICKSVPVYVLATLFLAVYIKLSKVPVKYILTGLKPMILIIIFSAIINMFFTEGEIIFKWKFISFTNEGIINAIYICLRLIYMIIGSSLMTYTTTPTSLTDGIERMFGFLNKIKIPVHEIAMMMTIALRFIPILIEELDRIMSAQLARGADFESGNLIKKTKSLIPVIVPLFVSAIKRANDLSMAMDSRCYKGGAGRTKLHPLNYGKGDLIAYIIVFLYFVAIIALGIADMISLFVLK